MVDVDKQACRALAEKGYHSGLWLESYVTWDFLDKYLKAMEPGYLHLNWNHIPRMYLRKHYLRTLIIEKDNFHDCEDTARRKEYVVLVAIVQKLARYRAIPFSTAAEEF